MNMRHADVLTPMDGAHYEVPATRCYEQKDVVMQNNNGILGNKHTDHWSPCMRVSKLANTSHMHSLANGIIADNQQSRAEGYPMEMRNHAGKMTCGNLAHINVGLADPSKLGSLGYWDYPRPSHKAYPNIGLIRHQSDFPEREFITRQRERGVPSVRSSYVSSRSSSNLSSARAASLPVGEPRYAYNPRLYNNESTWLSTAKQAYIQPVAARTRTAGRSGTLGQLNLRCTSNMVRDQLHAY